MSREKPLWFVKLALRASYRFRLGHSRHVYEPERACWLCREIAAEAVRDYIAGLR